MQTVKAVNEHISQMNTLQKTGLLVTLFLLLAGLYLHNPLEGYVRSDRVDVTPPLPALSRIPLNWHREFAEKPRPFLAWSSRGSHTKYVENTGDILSYAVLVMVFGGAWVLIFRRQTG